MNKQHIKGETMNNEQIKNGALCRLKIGRWSAIVTLPKSNLGKTVPKEIIKITQDLVQDKKLIRKIGKIRRETKAILKEMALPFPIRGVYWVHKKRINDVNKIFKIKERQYRKNVQELCKQLPKIKKEFKDLYPDFYKEAYYPKKEELKKKFYFSWNFFTFNFPGKSLNIIPNKIFIKEKKKFTQMINKIEEMTINTIGNSLLVKVKALSLQCEHKKINKVTILGLNKIIKQWEDYWKDNINGKEIQEIMKQVKINMKKITKKKLLKNENFRDKVKKQMDKIEKQIRLIPNIKLNKQFRI